MKIALVILNWNGKNLLEQFLPSVIKYSSQANIYVADNNSSDDSIAYLKSNYPTIKIIQNKGNFGYALGYNKALQEIEEDIYALVNSDIEVTPNWLEPIIKLYNEQPNTAIIQPKILDYKNKSYFEYAGAAGGFIDKYGYPYCRGRVFNTIEKDSHQYDDIIDIFWASGACFFIKKDVFNQLKGFDADFFSHQEEIDLCWRAINMGHHIKYCGHSTVYHVGGATLSNNNPLKTFLNFRNSLWMLLKNLPKQKLFIILFTRMILDGLAGIKFITEGKFKHFFSILKAHIYFYLHISNFLQKRSANQLTKYYKINSIVYRYFVKNSKHFAEQ